MSEDRPLRRIVPRARLLWGLAATGVVLVTALTVLIGGPSTPSALAAPLR
ncbi:hypothetical protein O1M54_04575 [Streptomyces diastatochromogenes]|nr:hypothetical protein [Streptomyces diastatochromogenes]